MTNHFLAVVFVAVVAAGPADASEMRTWTDWNGKTFEAKITGFERSSYKLSRKADSLMVSGLRYSELTPKTRKLLKHLAAKEGLTDPGAAVPEGSTAVKELKYLTVLFQTKDGQTLKVPMDTLEGYSDETGDYKLACDESLAWQSANEEGDAATDTSSSDADQIERQRRQLEEDRRRLEADRRQWEQQRRQWEQDHRGQSHSGGPQNDADLRRREADFRKRQEQWYRDQVESDKRSRAKKEADAARQKKQAEAERKKREEDAKKKKDADKKRKDASKS
ncbi:MAG: hypothetical protein ABR915_01895 [Thermoguttaceae bacterium]|jgi:hypothetical protein